MAELLKLLVILSVAGLALACGDDSGGDGGDGDGDAADAGGEPAFSIDDLDPPAADKLPTATGMCPGFADGDGCTQDETSLICTFQPAGVELPRAVRIYMSDAARATDDSALVFFWHGLGGSASNAVLPLGGLGPDVVQAIVDAGGIVAAPEKEEGLVTSLQSLPWQGALGVGPQDDFLVMDDVTACALDQLSVDPRRIHTSGMSAGGIQTGRLTQVRSNYLASAVPFSGALGGTRESQDPDNLLPVMMFHGGPTDIIGPLKFQDEAEKMRDDLEAAGNFVVFCSHTDGHVAPPEAAQSAWQFFQAHPYGRPSPWADGLPDDLAADYCEL